MAYRTVDSGTADILEGMLVPRRCFEIDGRRYAVLRFNELIYSLLQPHRVELVFDPLEKAKVPCIQELSSQRVPVEIH